MTILPILRFGEANIKNIRSSFHIWYVYICTVNFTWSVRSFCVTYVVICLFVLPLRVCTRTTTILIWPSVHWVQIDFQHKHAILLLILCGGKVTRLSVLLLLLLIG